MGIYGGPDIINEGLILYLDAANYKSYTSGSSLWLDLTKNKYNGSLINGPTFNLNNNGSIVFDGTNDYCLLPTSFFAYPSANRLTIGFWFKSSQSNGGTLFAQQGSNNPTSGANGYVPVIYLRSDGIIRVEPFWTGSNANTVLSSAALNDNKWHNVTVSLNATICRLYIDGIYASQRSSLSQISYTSAYYYFIGAGLFDAARGTGSSFFSGNIADFYFYTRALSDNEILKNFNALRGRFGL